MEEKTLSPITETTHGLQRATLKSLVRDLDWLAKVIDTRLKLYFNNDCDYSSIQEIPVPELRASHYTQFLEEQKLSTEERLALVLALAPHLRPELLDVFFTRNVSYDRGFSEFGGVKGKNFGGFIPTLDTLLYILAGSDTADRLLLFHYFSNESPLVKQQFLKLMPVENGEPPASAILQPSSDLQGYFATGRFTELSYSNDFPARRIETSLQWSDLILDHHVMQEVEEIKTWIEHQEVLKSNPQLQGRIKPGYRSLFYGPPGTGKTLTVTLLGKYTEKEVYRIDLSMVVSKYIGETEKNLGKIFDMAENKNWILFFDEADALFGKRTATASSNDRYANQEVAYLLQRVEEYPGLVILATNLKSNIDDAFARRFQSMIHFPMPGPADRLKLWQKAFGKHIQQAANFDLKQVADKYAIAGGAIVNVLMYCLLMHLKHKRAVTLQDVVEGIRKELKKEGKTL